MSTEDRAGKPRVLIADGFPVALPSGRVVGSATTTGAVRAGTDAEATLSVDGDALRIAPLDRPGWGRSCLSYGPFDVRPGLGFTAHVLNGHHASQTYAIRRLSRQVQRWLIGSGTQPLPSRLPRLVRSSRRVSPYRRVRSWARHRGVDAVQLRDNMAVGLFSASSPAGPDELAAAFVVRSTSNGNGELLARLSGELVAVADRLTNIPLQLVVTVRQDSVLYAMGTLAGARGGLPSAGVRPLAIGTTPGTSAVYGGVQQMVSGEIGFSVDSRVFDVQMATMGELAPWCAGAHVADDLIADDLITGRDLEASDADRGGGWQVGGGTMSRSARGLVARVAGATARIDAGQPTSLIHARLGPDAARLGILWRVGGSGGPDGADGHWRLELTPGRWRILCRSDGEDTCLAAGTLAPAARTVQILDDGASLRAIADGRLLTTLDIGAPDAGATGVGIMALAEGPLGISHFEAHPRQATLPAPLRVAPPAVPRGRTLVIEDRFDGDRRRVHEAGPVDLDGRRLPSGATWRRQLGHGLVVVDAETSATVADAPGRTLYTLDWPHPDLADLRTTIVPVGAAKSRSRAGLVFVQDDHNYVVFNLWFNQRADGAASVSSFFCLDGLEDVYDAVWVNVGDRIRWDEPVDLRVSFDGLLYQAWLGDEPVLWRSLRDVYPQAGRLAIARVGIAANWEWGLDTGSRFLAFEAYGP